MTKSHAVPAAIVGLAISVFLIIFVTGCKKDDNPTTPPIGNPTSYVGTFAGPSESGTLHLSIAAAKLALFKSFSTDAVVSVTGYLKTSLGDSVAVSGTFNTANDSLYFTGGSYSFAGVAAGGTLTGNYTGPHGSGTFALQTATSTSVKTYAGIYTSQAGRSNGKFNLVVSASGSLTGLAVANDSSGGAQLSGTVVADSITIYLSSSSSVVLAHGSFTNSSHVAASGTYDNHTDDHGIWSCEESH